ncbi:MAG TPA: serpin family protein, partial [Paludibacteraceae bacterium]|nr:serpin family protein [Paludibacteraceae bacterium]HOU68441.1 serpin family protein [Paludibacteraceae bacterium]HPH63351.1 serpin family protein [Paludibacteraceae bacterium]HQF50304.1 serpin family protein [Paludibacteraceae bacterium]
MKDFKIFLTYSYMLGTCLTLSLTSCSDDEDDNDEPKNEQKENQQDQKKEFKVSTLTAEQIQEMTVGYNQFAWNYLTKVAESSTEKDKNFFVSPLSMGIDWAMLENGANDATSSEIKKAIGFDGYSNEDVNGYFYAMTKSLESADSVQFSLANAVFSGENLDSTFSYFLTNNYSAFVVGCSKLGSKNMLGLIEF